VIPLRPGWLGAYRGQARERTRNGKLERLCRQCGAWRDAREAMRVSSALVRVEERRAVKTWQLELALVAVVLGGTFYASGGGAREAVGSVAVLATFAHGQVTDRLAEHARATARVAANVNGHLGHPAPGTPTHAYCWRWARRYYVTKELLWLVYFASLHAWSALVGVGVFLLYPFWRVFHRRAMP
jgi:hypothetical protein